LLSHLSIMEAITGDEDDVEEDEKVFAIQTPILMLILPHKVK